MASWTAKCCSWNWSARCSRSFRRRSSLVVSAGFSSEERVSVWLSSDEYRDLLAGEPESLSAPPCSLWNAEGRKRSGTRGGLGSYSPGIGCLSRRLIAPSVNSPRLWSNVWRTHGGVMSCGSTTCTSLGCRPGPETWVSGHGFLITWEWMVFPPHLNRK